MNATAQRISLVFAVALLAGSLTRFAQLRFQSGEIYPAYSTLRADPLGSKILYESLRRLDSSRTRRNFEPLIAAKLGPNASMVFLGAGGFSPGDIDENLLNLARDGTRVVVALDARNSKGKISSRITRAVPAAPPSTTPTNTSPGLVPFAKPLLGLDLNILKEETNAVAKLERPQPGLPETIPWFGRYTFSFVTKGWQTIYSLNGGPVVIQKKSGLGTIVLIADSYPFSNEALRNEPQSDFLLWALGAGQIAFDETHLGVERGAGVAVLMRDFRLHGLALGCVLLMALWIWRSSAPFIPAHPPAVVVQAIEGKTARQAIVHLLRRNLKGTDLLKSGLAEWAKSYPAASYWQTVRLKEARKIVEDFTKNPGSRSVIDVQREISQLLYPNQK